MTRMPRIGVITFPGSCDDRDASARSVAGGDAVPPHADTDLDGCRGVIVPGGFSYGDYLRAGAIALRADDARGRGLRGRRRPRARYLQRLPGAVRGRFSRGAPPQPPRPLRLSRRRPRGRALVRPGSPAWSRCRPAHSGQASRGRLVCAPEADASRPPVRWRSAMPTTERRACRHACVTRRRQRVRPDAAPGRHGRGA